MQASCARKQGCALCVLFIVEFSKVLLIFMLIFMQAIADYRAGKLGEIAGMKERIAQTSKAKQTQQKSGSWNNSY